jgi:hypothetical protein
VSFFDASADRYPLVAHVKFLNFHGQHGARLSRDQSLYGHVKGQPTLLICLLSPFLFYAPDVHFRTLEEAWIDNLIHLNCWRELIGRLRGEWTDFTLYNTILLSVNVSFLAIPSVDPASSGPVPTSRNFAQNASYVSTITSVGSIIVALLLVRQNSSKSRETPEEAVSITCECSLLSLKSYISTGTIFEREDSSRVWTGDTGHHV